MLRITTKNVLLSMCEPRSTTTVLCGCLDDTSAVSMKPACLAWVLFKRGWRHLKTRRTYTVKEEVPGGRFSALPRFSNNPAGKVVSWFSPKFLGRTTAPHDAVVRAVVMATGFMPRVFFLPFPTDVQQKANPPAARALDQFCHLACRNDQPGIPETHPILT